jgi:hypothetical protein
MKILRIALPLFIASALSIQATLIQLDIDSDFSTPTADTQVGFDSMFGIEGATATIDGIGLTLFGGIGTANNRDRGEIVGDPNSDLLRDFAFKDGAGAGVAIRMAGLPSGNYGVESWHFDAGSAGQIQIEVRPQGGASTILVPTHNIQDSAAAAYQFTADGTTVYELIFRENDANNRARFNGIVVRSAIPEPSSALLFTFAGLGLIGVARRRATR